MLKSGVLGVTVGTGNGFIEQRKSLNEWSFGVLAENNCEKHTFERHPIRIVP